MNINGILVPIVTPFDNNGDVDAQKLTTLVEAFIEKGVAGIVACGTTGEYYTFSAAERELVLTTIAEAAKDKGAGNKVTLVAGINSLSTDHSIELAAQAKALGYDGLMLSATPYSLPEQDGIIAHFEKVADASELPIIMYNFPDRVGVAIEFDTVAHLAKHPNIVGVKESSGDFSHALRMLQANFDDFEVVCGCDDQPVDFFFWGAKSWIAGAANVFPAEQVALFNATQQGDWEKAKQIMSEIYPAIHSMESGNYNQKAKAGCLKGSMDVGSVRVPLTNMLDDEKAAFLALLSK
ncbi:MULTISPECIES: 4-hydroxy-tetrahydrodipicolinate synthase [unclassified Psychrobacter]|uniref:4-hydroxy-tetrahydrodipicolinate synthase n=1 Tax=unclassified Psychrobacter TaxID=196806 RepID=UPI0025B4E59C|nr:MULTISPECIES: 4-hydroxy-tetrahydrodipicolinate synthase [unclassified Psychrobacter]MDN3452326.1 4-hydroxy-tetrahydrodipicolinate synthase [Psychrobacter sp. APC 3350]MDN3502259.1 4-hydroxy-tetrahydrodipicolinate synthase [Psychrobacter sp. 5A.1]